MTAACGTYASGHRLSSSFESAITKIANAQAIVSALSDDMLIARSAADVERAGAEGKRAVIIDFQNTVALDDDLDRIPLFYGLGLRMVQPTYNLQNLVADGCTETYGGGLTYFGRAMVERLNEQNILVEYFAQGPDAPPNPCMFCNKCLFNVLKHPLGCYAEHRFESREQMLEQIFSVYDPTPFPDTNLSATVSNVAERSE